MAPQPYMYAVSISVTPSSTALWATAMEASLAAPASVARRIAPNPIRRTPISPPMRKVLDVMCRVHPSVDAPRYP
ncbi:hypothetical protein GCM10010449_13090 [Streptomyces rectiviolaceus]|uniref:Uncharacterized protein n=1 Tax=Streptomyces rectiviolaceus TaxID=332591 RepID=A0ABP6MAW6_9ACTN